NHDSVRTCAAEILQAPGYRRDKYHSGLAPENLTTLAHFSVSSVINLPNSAGVVGIGPPPSSARRVLSRLSASAEFNALFSVSTMTGEMPFGATIPYQTTAS